MKSENIERPIKLIRQRENCLFLRNDVVPWMLENPDRVDLDETNSDCGRFACVGGWYSKMKYGKEWSVALPDCSSDCLEFGIAQSQWNGFFGALEFGTLQDRIPRIETHIADLDQRIANWYEERLVSEVLV